MPVRLSVSRLARPDPLNSNREVMAVQTPSSVITTPHVAPVRRFLRPTEFFARLGISKATGWRWIASGKLKPPLALSDRVKVFDASYLDEIHSELLAGAEDAA